MIQVYHGSDYDFDDFSFKNMGKSSGTTGAGFGLYFSNMKAEAFAYGTICYSCMIELKNPISNKVITLTPKQVLLILDKLFEKYGRNYYENFGLEIPISEKSKSQVINNLLRYTESDTEIIGDIIIATGCGNDIFDILCNNLNINHTIDTDSPDASIGTHYIMYELDSINLQKKERIEDL